MSRHWNGPEREGKKEESRLWPDENSAADMLFEVQNPREARIRENLYDHHKLFTGNLIKFCDSLGRSLDSMNYRGLRGRSD